MPDLSKMTWEKSSQELIDLFTSLAPTAAGVQQKKMFGWPCCFVNGNLFALLHKQSMIFRLAEPDQAVFLKIDGAAEFEPMPGRKMRGYVILSEPGRRDRKELAKWLDRSLRFAAALPPKATKPRATKTAGARATTKRKSKA
jgi:TfoX/Sxy family transcriptional regulator of competence genes